MLNKDEYKITNRLKNEGTKSQKVVDNSLTKISLVICFSDVVNNIVSSIVVVEKQSQLNLKNIRCLSLARIPSFECHILVITQATPFITKNNEKVEDAEMNGQGKV